jgi:signal transduction histidine kinase/ActR/RegA family two-component response regulator/HAMP domain-containing protein
MNVIVATLFAIMLAFVFFNHLIFETAEYLNQLSFHSSQLVKAVKDIEVNLERENRTKDLGRLIEIINGQIYKLEEHQQRAASSLYIPVAEKNKLPMIKNSWENHVNPKLQAFLNGSKSKDEVLPVLGDLLATLEKHTFENKVIGSSVHRKLDIFKWGVPIVIFALMGFLLWASKLWLRKIYHILNATHRVIGGDFKTPLEVNGQDELDVLARNFNEMLEKLNQTSVSSEYFSNVINSLEQYLFDVDSDGTIRTLNSRAQKDFGIEVQGEKIDNYMLYSGSFKELIAEILENEEMKIQMSLSDSQLVPVRLSFSKLNFEGEESRYIILAKDIRDEEKLQAQVMQSAKLASIGELAAGVAHEINNPLMIISGNASKISKLAKGDPVIEHCIDKQEVSIGRIKNIVTGLRVFSRENDMRESVFDINQQIRESIDLIEEIYAKVGITIVKDLSSDVLSIRGNVGQFQQSLMNFVTNARDAMGEDGGTLSFKSELKGKKVYYQVSDTGRGIPADQIDRVFDTFFTTKEVGKGTGLGLAVTLKIIRDMGGEIDLSSKVGVGTKFTVSLPLVQEEIKNENLLIESVDKFEGRVLLVEDEKEVREVIAEELQEIGFEVVSAENGEIAREVLKEQNFDFVFSDIQMPKVNGIELIKGLPFEVRSSFKIILLTGGLNDQVQGGEFTRLADAALKKPFTRHDLIRVLISLSDRSQAA